MSSDDDRARDRERVARTRNTARYFTENRHIAWIALVATIVWGVYAYLQMPKAKDPVIEIRVAVATCTWPGAEAEKVEQLVTRKIEQRLGESATVEKIESISRTSVAIVYVTIKEGVDRANAWDDLQARLDAIRDLPQGAGPIQFLRDFGDTTTIMLTVASPKVPEVELKLRANAIEHAIAKMRSDPKGRATLVVNVAANIDADVVHRLGDGLRERFDRMPGAHDAQLFENPGFFAIDIATTLGDVELVQRFEQLADEQMRSSERHPDVWPVAVVRDPARTLEQLRAIAGDRYTYGELDQLTDQIQRRVQRLPIVAKVTRSGTLPEQIYLEYAQDRLASYGVQASLLGNVIAARNITAPGGILEANGRNVAIDASGAFANERQIGDVAVTTSAAGLPVYLRDLVDIRRDYQSPPRYLNYLVARDRGGDFQRTRAITLAITMRRGAQIGDFATQVDAELAAVKQLLPDDLILRRTSDQPLQVSENVGLFMQSLYEAIALVVLVALVGFWEWRSALLLALCIPITLAMTFGLMHAFGVDIQQISIASLIIALGLLIDDPVVAGDAIKNSLGDGWPARIAAWLGPTKLATAILFATITNIAAYLPFLTIPGDVGTFIHSLPIVLTLSLVASRIVSMTFVPFLGSWILRAPKQRPPSPEERRSRGFGRFYAALVGRAIDHRGIVMVLAVGLLVGGGFYAKRVRSAFFPKDLSYLSYIDVWLPEDASLAATRAKVVEVENLVRSTLDEYGRDRDEPVLESITEFDGGGGPRFWFSVSPQLQQLNYAQLVLQVRDKEDTRFVVPLLQQRIAQHIAGARVDVGELETGKPIGVPVALRISGEDIRQLRGLADRGKAILRDTPGCRRVRDDWGADTLAVKLDVDPDRANLANVSNLDVALSSAAAVNGATVGKLREGEHEIAIVSRLRPEDRAQIADLSSLYVSSLNGPQKVPLGQLSKLRFAMQTEKIRRRNQFRTITVSCFPAAGMLPSEVLSGAAPAIAQLRAELPRGYRLEIGGEAEEREKSMASMVIVFVMLVVAIYLALVVQFKNAIKPLVVFAALPFGALAAVVGLVAMGAPLSFMALLGIISLMGVIVSHIIVLFDFIEERREHGEPMREALLDAGLLRLRPVLVTVVATVLGLVPLALHGGPLWEPLCYAQIAGLMFATLVTLVLVPILYTIVIRDLGLVRWDPPRRPSSSFTAIDPASSATLTGVLPPRMPRATRSDWTRS